MPRARTNRGFTLIELMTVAVIIGILASIAIPNFVNAAIRAKVARSMSEQELALWAMEMYALDQYRYPPNREAGVSSPGDLVPLTTPIPYISSLPEDPFLSPSGEGKRQYVETQRRGHWSFYYVNFLQVNEERLALAPYGLRGSANYVIYGLSPSFNLDIDAMQPERFIRYSPSNGITSLGVLATFGP